MNANYSELLHALLPEAALIGGALAVLTLDLLAGRRRTEAARVRTSVLVGLLAIAIAAWLTWAAGVGGDAFGGVLRLDSLTLVARLGVLLLAGLTLAQLPEVLRLRHPAEYVAVLLFATTGFTLMAAAQQLLLAFIALELASLSLYVLAGFDKTRPQSAEAALKYFLFGGISAAFLLFGFSLLYGLTGSIETAGIARQLAIIPTTPLLLVALVMVLVGFGFKAAAAPFHLWAPDVYEGAPSSSAALISSASKLAGFTLFSRLLWTGLAPAAGGPAAEATPGWITVLLVMAAVSLLLGNLVALAQTNVRRLLAYSAIAHAGALLLGVVAAGSAGPAPLIYYAATYGIATVGAFGVVAVLDRFGGCQQLSDLAGLHRRSPFLAACLLIFVLSLAGIPPLAGFFGKFAVFAAALKIAGIATLTGWLVIAAILLSAVGLYYYLLILKQAWVLPARADAAATPVRVPLEARLSLGLSALLLIALGIFPSAVLRLF